MNWIAESSEVRKPHYRRRQKVVLLEPMGQIQAGEIKGVAAPQKLITTITTAVLTVAITLVVVSLTCLPMGTEIVYRHCHQLDIGRLWLEVQHLTHAYLLGHHHLPIVADTAGDLAREMTAKEIVSHRTTLTKVAEVTMATIPEIVLQPAIVKPMAAEVATSTPTFRAILAKGLVAQRVVVVTTMTIEEAMIEIVETTVAMNAAIDSTMEGGEAMRGHAVVAQSEIERGIVGESEIH